MDMNEIVSLLRPLARPRSWKQRSSNFAFRIVESIETHPNVPLNPGAIASILSILRDNYGEVVESKAKIFFEK